MQGVREEYTASVHLVLLRLSLPDRGQPLHVHPIPSALVPSCLLLSTSVGCPELETDESWAALLRQECLFDQLPCMMKQGQ